MELYRWYCKPERISSARIQGDAKCCVGSHREIPAMEGLDELRAECRGNILLPQDGPAFRQALQVWAHNPWHEELPKPALVVQPRGELSRGEGQNEWCRSGAPAPHILPPLPRATLPPPVHPVAASDYWSGGYHVL